MKPECGVDKILFSEYSFQDHLWNNLTEAGKQTYKPKDLLELAQRAVIVGSDYYLKVPNLSAWKKYDTLIMARRAAYNTWIGSQLSSGTTVDQNIIDVFFTGNEEHIGENGKYTVQVGSIPHLDATVSIPLGPRFILYENKRCFNIDNVNILIGDSQYVNEDVIMLLRLIYRSLCNGDALCDSVEEEGLKILEMITSNNMEYLEFKFVINWFAAIYQRPGINLQTNLWLVGQQNGVGKGTLAEIMKSVLGASAVCTLDKHELQKGWNGPVLGKVLVLIDEFKVANSRYGWSGDDLVNWIKETTCEPVVIIKMKGIDQFYVINIGNYFFMGNDEVPIDKFDQTDRRNVFIKTTDDPAWKIVATFIRSLKSEHPDRWNNMCKGFAWILETVDVDYVLLKEAPATQHRIDVLEESQPNVLRWLKEEGVHTEADEANRIGINVIKRNTWVQAKDLMLMFDNYLGTNNIIENLTASTFGRAIKQYFRIVENGKLGDPGKKSAFGIRKVGRVTEYCLTDDPEAFLRSTGELGRTAKKAASDAGTTAAKPAAMTNKEKLERARAKIVAEEKAASWVRK